MLNVFILRLIGGLEIKWLLGLLDTLHMFICCQNSLFRLCSWRAFVWYQNGVSRTLRSNFIAKFGYFGWFLALFWPNFRSFWPSKTTNSPEKCFKVVICGVHQCSFQMSHQPTFYLAHKRNKCAPRKFTTINQPIYNFSERWYQITPIPHKHIIYYIYEMPSEHT